MLDWRLTVVLAVLLATLVGGAHATGTVPATRRQWAWVWVAVVFLLWLLLGFRGVRA